MKFNRKITSPKIMIIPMIDIIFFLLVFFMMNMLSMVHLKTIPVQLPASSMAETITIQPVAISITRKGNVFVGDKQIALSNLKNELKMQHKIGKKLEVLLNADKGVPYGRVIKVLDQIKDAGIADVVVATE